jgi:hypothetical protein
MTYQTHPNPPPDPPPEYRSPDGLIRLHCDTTTETFYIEASPGYVPSGLRVALRRAYSLGLEPLDPADEQEGEAWTLDDGTTRIWLAESAEPGAPPAS